YYADVETGCQVFHVCSRTSLRLKDSFLCPNGSLFNQEFFACDWWDNVDCSLSENFYSLNMRIGKADETLERMLHPNLDRTPDDLRYS
ncbi:hypothetical protein Cfor_12270, partial [Coptotermes formosanus]